MIYGHKNEEQIRSDAYSVNLQSLLWLFVLRFSVAVLSLFSACLLAGCVHSLRMVGLL